MSSDDVIELIVQHIKPQRRQKLIIGVLTSGNGSNLQALMDYSRRAESFFTISTVITNKPESRALERAENAGISNHLVDHRDYVVKRDFEHELIAHLKHGSVDLVVLAGFLRVLTNYFLEHYEQRIINLHPSLLPKHKGLDAIGKAQRAGDRETGTTVHLVDIGLDTGPLIAQSSCPIHVDDHLDDIKARIQKLEHELLPDVVNRIAKRVITRDCA